MMFYRMHKHFSAFLILTILLATTPLLAQNKLLKWGKISKEDLAMTAHPEDSEAEAYVLGSAGYLFFDLTNPKYILEFQNHHRIKIFNQNGIDAYGNQSISYYAHDGATSITGLKAQVLLPNGDKISISKKDIVDQKIDDYWNKITIPFTNLTPGAIIEYEYALKSNYLLNPIDWYFQREIPVRNSELDLRIPEYYEYVFLTQGRQLDVNEKDRIEQRVNYTTTGNNRGTTGFQLQKQDIQQHVANVPITTYKMAMKDVPAMRKEAYITTMKDHYARLSLQLKKIAYPNSPTQPVMSDWNKLAKDLMDGKSFGQQITTKRYQRLLEKEAGLTKSGYDTEKEFAKAVANHIAQEIKWNDIYSLGSSRGLNEAYEKKTGTSGEKNMLFIATMKNAEIAAFPILTSTRGHGRMQELYPYIDQFNTSLILVELDGKEMIVDLTEDNIPFGMIHENALNKRGFVVIEDNPQWIDITPKKSNSIYLVDIIPDADGTAEGSIQARFMGYDAVSEYADFVSDNDNYFSDRLSENMGDIETRELNTEAFVPTADKINLTLAFDEVQYQSAGDFLYISPMIVESITENPFKAIDRKYPIDLAHNVHKKYIINITIPEGFVVESMPEPAVVQSEDKALNFKYAARSTGDKIQITSNFEINGLFFLPEMYPDLKKYFDLVIEKFGEQITLKKE